MFQFLLERGAESPTAQGPSGKKGQRRHQNRRPGQQPDQLQREPRQHLHALNDIHPEARCIIFPDSRSTFQPTI